MSAVDQAPSRLDPRLWASSVHRGDDGALRVAGADVRDLAARWGTPAYLLDEEDFRQRARAFRDAFAAAFADSGADVFYAGKAFLCTAVARWVHEEGLCLDVCTGGELAVAVRAGVPGERIGLHGNNKSVEEIEAALRHGVGRIVLDSFDEIERVTEVAGRLGVVAPVMIRVTTGVAAHTHEFVATAHEDQKFGFSLSGGRAVEAADRVLARPDRLLLLGLHSHIGSQIFDVDGFEVSTTRLVRLHTDIARRHGTELAELDLGGGFGIAYTSEEDPLPPEQLAQGLADVVRRECAANSVAVPHISIEPGRSVAGPSTFTLYRVGTVKQVDLGQDGRRTYVSVDGGMSDNIRPALYGAQYSCVLADRVGSDETVRARVVGKHCESGDIVVRDTRLPADVAPGDLLAVPGTGAYCYSLANQYNHVARPPVVAVRDGQSRPIVRRETIDDLLALDVE
ncbi:MAG TPA: diaminopimelate decarboxylase [Segeticoccus sp.]|uniref:diaminopimelate decarboxylase n=1 Tax=Segeticoccus sp. TaxID=2706531 RepID=UPI002D7F2BFB|nr:diaminopimelate decarboxylase [Segeticoccus sp.]HET8599535.1 diaminopimelate decarboxylase [Segeticoccus sp.]